MCCRLARTINGCETATEVQELFGIRNDLIGQSILIAETKYYCRRNYFMYQDALGSFTLTDEFKSHSRRNTVRNICDDSADIKSRRCAWRRADINIEGSASNYRGHTAVSISNKAGEQRVVWKSKLDYASQRIAADMVNGRSRTGPVAGLPMEVLLLMLSMVRLAQRSYFSFRSFCKTGALFEIPYAAGKLPPFPFSHPRHGPADIVMYTFRSLRSIFSKY